MATWSLTIEQLEVQNRTHRKQLRIIWSDENKKNNQSCKERTEKPIKEEMRNAG